MPAWMLQAPSAQVSVPLQNRLSLHAVPVDLKESAGQVFDVPLHASATSQAPEAARHTDVRLVFAGHEALLPVQLSGASQIPAAARQTVAADS